MIRFYLIRHGQKEKIFGDPSLTEIGRKQAEITGQFLKNKNIKSIYSSYFKRTLQTAEIIAKELNLKVQIDETLKERMNWGDKKEETFAQFLKEWRKTDIDRNYQPIQGDSSYNSGKRMEVFIQGVIISSANADIVVVTHGGIIGDFLRNIFPEKELPIIIEKETQAKYIEILECSITVFRSEQRKFTLEQVGSIAHLPPPLI